MFHPDVDCDDGVDGDLSGEDQDLGRTACRPRCGPPIGLDDDDVEPGDPASRCEEMIEGCLDIVGRPGSHHNGDLGAQSGRRRGQYLATWAQSGTHLRAGGMVHLSVIGARRSEPEGCVPIDGRRWSPGISRRSGRDGLAQRSRTGG